jgi:hypothetical protein
MEERKASVITPRGWSLIELPLGPEHAGTLCVSGRRLRVRLLG